MELDTLEAFVDECCINSDSIDYDLAADEEEGRAELTIGYEEDGYAIEVEYEITQENLDEENESVSFRFFLNTCGSDFQADNGDDYYIDKLNNYIKIMKSVSDIMTKIDEINGKDLSLQ